MTPADRRHQSGRPLRALALLGLLLGLWLAARLPVLLGDARRIIAALQPAPRPSRPDAEPPAMLALTTSPTPAARQPVPPRTPPRRAFTANIPAITTAKVETIPPRPPIIPPPPIAEAAAPPPQPATTGFDLATGAFAALAANDRRTAAALLQQAIDAGPDPRRAQWQAQRRSLTRRWSADAYALIRAAGATGPTTGPLLGGGQSGASLAYTPDPLARRPLAIVARLNAANSDDRSAQAALGLRWQPAKAVTLSAERLIAIGDNGRNDWTLRAAAGTTQRHGRTELTGYGEAGILGNGEVYAGVQTRATYRLARIQRATIAAGPGAWASVQTGVITTHRTDIGPSVVARTSLGRLTLELAADWRFRVAGNAAPGSGPALTLSTRF